MTWGKQQHIEIACSFLRLHGQKYGGILDLNSVLLSDWCYDWLLLSVRVKLLLSLQLKLIATLPTERAANTPESASAAAARACSRSRRVESSCDSRDRRRAISAAEADTAAEAEAAAEAAAEADGVADDDSADDEAMGVAAEAEAADGLSGESEERSIAADATVFWIKRKKTQSEIQIKSTNAHHLPVRDIDELSHMHMHTLNCAVAVPIVAVAAFFAAAAPPPAISARRRSISDCSEARVADSGAGCG